MCSVRWMFKRKTPYDVKGQSNTLLGEDKFQFAAAATKY